MKTLLKLTFLITLAVVTFSSCSKNDNADFEKVMEEQRIKDSINNARIAKLLIEQAPLIKNFADQNLVNASLDTASGIRFQIVQAGDDASYSYKINNGVLVSPNITVKYKGTLLNGDVFDQTTADKNFTASLASLINAWHRAFIPKNLTFNGTNYKIGGLTANGLKKGSIIKMVTPSPWAYDAQNSTKIPANSPLYFEIEVVAIN